LETSDKKQQNEKIKLKSNTLTGEIPERQLAAVPVSNVRVFSFVRVFYWRILG
jgi:hypothetical protein